MKRGITVTALLSLLCEYMNHKKRMNTSFRVDLFFLYCFSPQEGDSSLAPTQYTLSLDAELCIYSSTLSCSLSMDGWNTQSVTPDRPLTSLRKSLGRREEAEGSDSSFSHFVCFSFKSVRAASLRIKI